MADAEPNSPSGGKIVENFSERQAESKVIPPANPTIRYPEVAVIPPGQKSVVVIPKDPDQTKTPEEMPQAPIRMDVVLGEPTPK